MAKKVPTWVVGCGIGCGLILIIVIGLGAAGAVWVRGMTRGMDEAVRTRTAMEERFGEPGEFTPSADGSIPAARVEAFLRVRESLDPAREEIAAALSKLPFSDAEGRALKEKPLLEKLGSVFSIGGSALGLAGSIGDFFRDRNILLLEHEMGMGEYSYIYVLAYYGLLRHSPSDGPGDLDVKDIDSRGDNIQLMGPHASSRIHWELASILQNQRASLPDGAPAALRRSLDEEIAALEEDRHRFPWQDNMPDVVRASLEPFRDRLEATYHPATNPFELARNRKRGRFSYTSD